MADDMINISALEEQMNEVNKKFEEFRKITEETSKKVFHEAVSTFFKNFPEVYAVRWEQYTPYFNDGDTCTFSVGVPCFFSMKDFEDDIKDDYEYISWARPSDYVYRSAADKNNKYWETYQEQLDKYEALEKELGPRLEEIQKGVKQFSNLFNKINDDSMLAMFGDHVQITVTSKGIDIDEYEHD